MFYETKAGHGLPRDPFVAIVAPRPIAWITTVDLEGRPNLAPYSFFNAFSARPPLVGFSSEGLKDSNSNARDTGEFVVNLVSRDLAEQMNETSRAVPRGVDEMQLAGLAAVPSRLVKPMRVAGAPAALECRTTQVLELTDVDGKPSGRMMTFGQVIGVHIDDRCMKDGRFDIVEARLIARCGYFDYAPVPEVFEMKRPDAAGH